MEGKLEESLSTTDSLVDRNEVFSAVETALRELPHEQRTAFVMSEYEGASYRQIAEVLGVSLKSTEMHLYRARMNLRERLKHFL
jgi:RNA polymerase sigma-70 factor, ECF subfamily